MKLLSFQLKCFMRWIWVWLVSRVHHRSESLSLYSWAWGLFLRFILISYQNDCSGLTIRSHHIVGKDRKLFSSLRSNSIELFGQRVARVGADLHRDWNFLGGSRIIIHPKLTNFLVYRKSSGVNASCNSSFFQLSALFIIYDFYISWEVSSISFLPFFIFIWILLDTLLYW
jgi:hypothetical protein